MAPNNATSSTKMRVAIYCRVSSAGQEDNSSLDTQERGCRAFAAERGWAVAAVYREVHTGADLFERSELTQLRDAMRRGAFDVLLVHALDRLSRKQTHQGLILSEAEYADVRWASVTEDLDDSPQGQILRAVIGGMAELERLKLAERTVRGRRARALAGKRSSLVEPPCMVIGGAMNRRPHMTSIQSTVLSFSASFTRSSTEAPFEVWPIA